jgi:hypothetical protein
LARTIIREAIVLGTISVGIPTFVIAILSFIGGLLKLGQELTTLVYVLFTFPFGILFYREILRRLDPSKLKPNKKQDWDRLALGLTLVFTIIVTLVALQALYGQTTQSRCFDPPKVNVTSPNCTVIQTVTVQQSATFTQILDVLLLGVGAFGVWTVILYVLSKADFEAKTT